MRERRFRIAILSCTPDDWGGSEDLWARSVPILIKNNCDITVYKSNINFSHPEMVTLSELGVRLVPLVIDYPPFFKRVVQKVKSKFIKEQPVTNTIATSLVTLKFGEHIKTDRPDLAIIIQGINFDGLEYAYECLQLNIPYIVFANKGVDFYWPAAEHRPAMRRVLQSAKKCFFSSKHNLTLTEEQFGFRFSNAQILWNTVKLSRTPLPFPVDTKIIKLACVGRLFVIDKGQDMLFRILSREPWRSRNVEVSLIGKGADEEGLKDMAELLNLHNVKFFGQQNDISEVWKTHHALILPSRSEGLALSLIEAMAAGRPAITTIAGGHPEVIQHGVNGFICDIAESNFEECMEQAWEQRENWEEIGIKANKFVTNNIPEHPEEDFASSIIKLLHEQ